MWPFGGNFFPGTNLQDLNLDWIINKVRELSDTVSGMEGQIESAAAAAEAAQQSANSAETSAQSAENAAQGAQTAAQAAQTAAQAAQTDTATINTYLSEHIPVEAVDDLGTNGETAGTSSYPTPYGVIRVLRFTANTLSHPGPATSGGFCITFAISSSNGVQIALVLGQRNIFVRSRNSGTWLEWAAYAPPAAGTTGMLSPVSDTLDTGALDGRAELGIVQPQDSAN